HVGDADILQKHLGGGDGVGLGLAQHAPRRLDDVVEDGHVGPQIEALENKAHPRPQSIDLGVIGGNQRAIATGVELELLTGDQDLALLGIFQQVDAAQQGAFPGAGGAEDGNDVAIPGQQVDALENLKIAIALVQVAHFESRGCHVKLSNLKQCRKASTGGGYDQ